MSTRSALQRLAAVLLALGLVLGAGCSTSGARAAPPTSSVSARHTSTEATTTSATSPPTTVTMTITTSASTTGTTAVVPPTTGTSSDDGGEVGEVCTPADPALVGALEAHLSGPVVRLAKAYADTDELGRVFVAAAGYDGGGSYVSYADTWVIVGGAAYTLSYSATVDTPGLPDGRALGISYSDKDALEVQECVDEDV